MNIKFNNIILLIILIIPLFASANVYNQYYRHLSLHKDSLFLKAQGDSINSLMLEARLSVNKNKERYGFSNSNWRLIWNYNSDKNYRYVEVKWKNTNFGDILDQRQLVVNIGENRNGEEILIQSVEFDKGVNLYTGENTVQLEVNENRYSVFIGEEYLRYVGSYVFDDSLSGKCGLMTSVNANICSFSIKSILDLKKTLKTTYTEQVLKEKFRLTRNIHEAFWSYLDRDNDPKFARLGGSYRIALVKDNDDYLLIYISGAQTNQKNWSEGMIKGRLKSTIFQNHYDLIWYDSMFEIIDNDAFATIENSVLTLEFPIYKTKIRFYKEM